MVTFSFKPGDQTDETESPNLVNKQDYSKKVSTKAFSNSISIIKIFSLAGD